MRRQEDLRYESFYEVLSKYVYTLDFHKCNGKIHTL